MDFQLLETKITNNHYFNSVNLQQFVITRNVIRKMSNYTLLISPKNFVLETSILALHNFFLLQLQPKTLYSDSKSQAGCELCNVHNFFDNLTLGVVIEYVAI